MKPNNLALMGAIAIAASGVGVGPAFGGHGHHGGLDKCLHAAAAIKRGDFVKVEYLDPTHEGVPSYEIEVRDADGMEWEFMCDKAKGRIYEIEQEVDSPSHELFAKHMKVDVEAAKAAVLALYPGEIEEVEYEIEANGDASYEIDVVDANGVEFKVEVDAASGDIIEVHVEKWEIGEEANEKP